MWLETIYRWQAGLTRSTPVRYGFAVLAVAFAVLVRWPLNAVLDGQFPFLLPFCVVTAAAWFGGRGPGLLSVVLAALFTWFFILPTSMTFTGINPLGLYQLVVFMFAGSVVALLSGSLRMANDAIRDREAQLEFMAAAMPEILFTTDSSGQIETLSERFREYAGKDLSALSPLGWMDLLHPDDRVSTINAWKTAIGGKTEFRSTCRLGGKDEDYRWFQCRAVPMQDKQRRVLRWFGVCADVDDRKRLEETLAAQTQALTRSNEDLQRFAFAASHDLQEPLRMIGVFSGLLMRNLPADTDSDYFADQIRTGVQRMQDLIDSALEYARITTNKGETRKVIDLEEPLTDALWSLQAAIQESEAQIDRSPLPKVLADPRMISRVFQNLIGNAIKFRGPERPVIRIAATKQSETCIVAVSDNGIGMAMGYAKFVFEAFRRLHPKSEYPGSGLGLASVKRIVELHHGRVWVESEPGSGSTFFFTLPIAPERLG
jgi:PAS domain S-box-containing protein